MGAAEFWRMAHEHAGECAEFDTEPFFLTRQTAERWLKSERWTLNIAEFFLAGVNPFLTERSIEAAQYGFDDFSEDINRAQKLREVIRHRLLDALLIRHPENEPLKGWAPGCFMGECAAVTIKSDWFGALPLPGEGYSDGWGYVDSNNTAFSVRSFYEFAKAQLLPAFDVPIFGLFHDRQAESAAIFNGEQSPQILEPLEAWAAFALFDARILSEAEIEALCGKPMAEIERPKETTEPPPWEQPDTPSAQQTENPGQTAEDCTQNANSAAQPDTEPRRPMTDEAANKFPKKKRLTEDYDKMACVANALDKLRNGIGGRNPTDADICREIAAQARRRLGKVIDAKNTSTPRGWLAAWRSLPKAEHDRINARSLGRAE